MEGVPEKLLEEFEVKSSGSLSSLSQIFHQTVRVPFFEGAALTSELGLLSRKRDFFSAREAVVSAEFGRRLEAVLARHRGDDALLRVFGAAAEGRDLRDSPQFQGFVNCLFAWRTQMENLQNEIVKVDFYLMDISKEFAHRLAKLNAQLPSAQINLTQLMSLYIAKMLFVAMRSLFAVSNVRGVGTFLPLLSLLFGVSGSGIASLVKSIGWVSFLPFAFIFKSGLSSKISDSVDHRISANRLQGLASAFQDTNEFLLKANAVLRDLLRESMAELGSKTPNKVRLDDYKVKIYRVLENLLVGDDHSPQKIDRLFLEHPFEFKVVQNEWVLYSSDEDTR